MNDDLRRGGGGNRPQGKRSRYAPAEIANPIPIPTQYVTTNQHPSPNAYAHTQTNVVDVPSSPKQIQKSCVGYWLRNFCSYLTQVLVRIAIQRPKERKTRLNGNEFQMVARKCRLFAQKHVYNRFCCSRWVIIPKINKSRQKCLKMRF